MHAINCPHCGAYNSVFDMLENHTCYYNESMFFWRCKGCNMEMYFATKIEIGTLDQCWNTFSPDPIRTLDQPTTVVSDSQGVSFSLSYGDERKTVVMKTKFPQRRNG
jgi:hypothetical protein